MGDEPILDYKSPATRAGPRTGCRDAGILVAGLVFLAGCPVSGYLWNLSVGLNYIDGAEGRPVTPEDQVAMNLAAAFPSIGLGLFALGIGTIVYLHMKKR